MNGVYAISFLALVFYSISRPKKKPHPAHKLLQPEKFRAIHSHWVPPKKYVIPDAAYEWAEKQIINNK